VIRDNAYPRFFDKQFYQKFIVYFTENHRENAREPQSKKERDDIFSKDVISIKLKDKC